MTQEIATGSILPIKANTRLVHLGNRRAAVEMLMEKRFTKTGARIIGDVDTYWEKTQEIDLTDAQITFWLSKGV